MAAAHGRGCHPHPQMGAEKVQAAMPITPSQKRRLARRHVARRNAPRPMQLPIVGLNAPEFVPDTQCPRCKSWMGSYKGRFCYFWHGVARRRRQVLARVCDPCVGELRKTGPGGDLGMHGEAYHTRQKAKFPAVPDLADHQYPDWWAWYMAHRNGGSGTANQRNPAIALHAAGARPKTPPANC